jgi:hypothetical protein
MIQGWTPTETIALTPASRAGLERELRLLRGDRLPALTARLAEALKIVAISRYKDPGKLSCCAE